MSSNSNLIGTSAIWLGINRPLTEFHQKQLARNPVYDVSMGSLVSLAGVGDGEPEITR